MKLEKLVPAPRIHDLHMFINTESGRRVLELKSYTGESFNDITTEEADAYAKKIVTSFNNHDELVEALDHLIFTAKALWDKDKPLKDTATMIVTHPTIEKARELLLKVTKP